MPCLNADRSQTLILHARRAGPRSSPPGRTRDRFAQSPSAAGDRLLLLRQHRDGDRRAREELIRRNMPLARQLARRYYHGREPFDDLLQVAHLGLVKAADRFDVERSTSFASFAVPTILGELRRHFRDTGWAMRVPRPLQEQVLEVRKISDRLFADTGRAPTAADIATALEVPYEQILDALALAHGDQPLSLDGYASSQLDDQGETLGERFGTDETGYELVEDRDAAADAIRRLPHLERVVLGLRFLHDLKQSDIAAQLGCSQMQVSRLLRQALSKLAEFASEDDQLTAVVG